VANRHSPLAVKAEKPTAAESAALFRNSPVGKAAFGTARIRTVLPSEASISSKLSPTT
jgi:hypothetical protein